MDISEAETGVLQLRREPVALRALLAEVVELYEDVADAKKVPVALEPGDEVVVSGARDRLRQVFANLLDNAIKYTPESGQVRIAVARDGDTAVRHGRRYRRRHRRRAPAADLGAPLSSRPQPFRAWPGPRPQPGQGLRAGPRRHRRGRQRARPRLDVYRPPAASAST